MFGDHEGAETCWLDDTATIIRCPRCGRDAYARTRAISGGGYPLHRHVIVACPPCGLWQPTCLPEPIPQADLPQRIP